MDESGSEVVGPTSAVGAVVGADESCASESASVLHAVANMIAPAARSAAGILDLVAMMPPILVVCGNDKF